MNTFKRIHLQYLAKAYYIDARRLADRHPRPELVHTVAYYFAAAAAINRLY